MSKHFFHRMAIGFARLTLHLFSNIAGKASGPAAAVELISSMAWMMSFSVKVILCRDWAASVIRRFFLGRVDGSIGLLKAVVYCLESNSAISLLSPVSLLLGFSKGPIFEVVLDFFLA